MLLFFSLYCFCVCRKTIGSSMDYVENVLFSTKWFSCNRQSEPIIILVRRNVSYLTSELVHNSIVSFHKIINIYITSSNETSIQRLLCFVMEGIKTSRLLWQVSSSDCFISLPLNWFDVGQKIWKYREALFTFFIIIKNSRLLICLPYQYH